jgi:hypothetical protein
MPGSDGGKIRAMSQQIDITSIFPNLRSESYQETSPPTITYNCIAWAAGKKDRWWEPVIGYYWPLPVPQLRTVQVAIRAFKVLGYTECDNSEVEKGYEKIAIYGEQDDYTHAARQLGNGKWTSKLGQLEDIEHDTLEALTGIEYGQVAIVMKRPLQTDS